MFQATSYPPVILDDGRHLPVQLINSRRAVRIAIRLRSWGAVELVVPSNAKPADAIAFLNLRMPWVVARARTLPAAVTFEPGAELPILGVAHRLVAAPAGQRPIFRIDAGLIEIGGQPAHFARRTRDGLRGHALRLLSSKTLAEAARLGRPVSRIGIGDMRSRWGSCSGSGRIRYSWRLVFAPEPIMDYVVCHEVAHLVEMNHASRFWRIVERLYPEYPTARAWLKRQGPALLRYG